MKIKLFLFYIYFLYLKPFIYLSAYHIHSIGSFYLMFRLLKLTEQHGELWLAGCSESDQSELLLLPHSLYSDTNAKMTARRKYNVEYGTPTRWTENEYNWNME